MKVVESTGSIAQDALRLGFQTTCSKGVAKLLKVDDATAKACDEFNYLTLGKKILFLKLLPVKMRKKRNFLR